MKRPSKSMSAVFAIVAACSLPVAVMGAGDPQATKPAGQVASPSTPPMIIHNPDGTFTVQKVPPKEHAKEAAEKGLVIPPQVVVPIVLPAEKRK